MSDKKPKYAVIAVHGMVKGLLATDAARANAFFEKHLKWKKLV